MKKIIKKKSRLVSIAVGVPHTTARSAIFRERKGLRFWLGEEGAGNFFSFLLVFGGGAS